jgi:hypothetical protein
MATTAGLVAADTPGHDGASRTCPLRVSAGRAQSSAQDEAPNWRRRTIPPLFGYVISLYRASAEILDGIVLLRPRAWVQIWPAVCTSEWPQAEQLPTGRVNPLFAGLPVRRSLLMPT